MIEPDEYGAMIVRLLKAYGRRLRVSGDPDDLPGLSRINDEVERQLRFTAYDLIDCGWPQARVASALGLSRQAVNKWWLEKEIWMASNAQSK